MSSKVIQANIDVHTKVAESYMRLEPHFRPENKAKVRDILTDLRNVAAEGSCSTSAAAPASSSIWPRIFSPRFTA